MRVVRVAAPGLDVLSISDRDRILQAMAEACAGAGYRETTVETVLDRAGVNRDVFELHFAGKEDCALAALNKIVSESLARVSMIGREDLPAVERRRHEVWAVVDLLSARPEFARLGCIDARQGGTAAMRESYESAVRVLALMMERAGTARFAATTSATAARAALGGIEALVRRELVAGRPQRLPRLVPEFVYAALVPFVGQGEALRQAKLAAKAVLEEES